MIQDLLDELQAVSDGWPAGEQEAYTLLAEMVMDGWMVVGHRPGWYYRLAHAARPGLSVVVPVNPDAADFDLLLSAARSAVQ